MLSVFFLDFFEDFFGVSETEPDGVVEAESDLLASFLLKRGETSYEAEFTWLNTNEKLQINKIWRGSNLSDEAESAEVVDDVLSPALDMLTLKTTPLQHKVFLFIVAVPATASVISLSYLVNK